MTATLDDEVAELRRANAELQRRLDERTAERDEALEQQTATAEVLGVINSSPGNLQPVFEAIIDKAMQLCDAASGRLGTWQGDRFAWAAARGSPQLLVEFAARNAVSVGSRSGFARVARGEGYVHFTDRQL